MSLFLKRGAEAESFLGLDANTKRYDLLTLVKRVGKSAGFTSRMEDHSSTTSSCQESMKMSFRDAVNVVHYNSTNQLQSNKLDTDRASPIGFQGRRNSEICEGAALCLLLTDHAALRTSDPVTKPAGYFMALINRAETGDLHLHRSIFTILKRECGA